MSTDTVLPGNPNTLPDRQAMGLPERFVPRIDEDEVRAHAGELRTLPAEDLVQVAESVRASFERRFAAGSLLALIGDPRIRPDDPPMVTVPAARVAVGLAPDRVASVVRQWAHVGVIEPWIRKETPRHEVPIDAFRMMRYPVTNAEFRAFLDDTENSWLPSSWRFGGYPTPFANHPVWTVPPEAADAYAEWLAARTGRAFRLPTEAEWEYAAGGAAGTEFPWGDDFRPDAANTVEAGPLCTTPIGIYPQGRSPLGILDLAGNVEEFVADDYRPYPGGEAVHDDLVGTGGGYRVARGGSFTRFGDLARCRRRHGWFARPIYAMGFRLAEAV